MATRAEAKEVVDRIAGKYGLLRDELMERIGGWDPSARLELEKNWLAMESMAANSIKTLAKQIYGSGARFIFELLQNADDNRFGRALAGNQLPYISFQVHPDRIVVDCNEDGFNENDLTAICAVGQSTKSASHGYIGAKGIGFKSVFIAASRVDIQSGNYSFYFRHEKGDPGLGMVIPRWQQDREILNGPLTRMVLHLHKKGDPTDVKHLRDTIHQQLNDLQQTCLLFLKKLRRIRVEFYNSNGGIKSYKEFSIQEPGARKVSLDTTFSTSGREQSTRKHYHVTRHIETNLARSDNRELPDTEEARRMSSSAEVVLAFPLTSDSEPLIEKQDIFAFLPVRESDYHFLIQSDFDTSANRQDIVTTSRRNLGLQNGIAAAFIKAVLEFCEHPGLCYSWPQFLPFLDEATNPFWSRVSEMIQERVSTSAIFKSRHRHQLRRITNIRRMACDVVDEEGKPLFDDSQKDPYISERYGFTNLTRLVKYGLKYGLVDIFLELMEDDLNSSNSRWRAASTSQKWHSAAVVLPQRVLENNWECKNQILGMPIVPLRDGRWDSIPMGPIFLPTTKGVTIPSGLDIKVIDSSVMKNKDRKAFFLTLGVAEAPISDITRAISRAFRARNSVPLAHATAFLRYLYLTHVHDNILSDVSKWILVYDQMNKLVNPFQQDVYFSNDDQYGPAALLKPSDGDSGFTVSFLHTAYFDDPPEKPHAEHPSWEEWISECIGVRQRLRLASPDGKSLSEPFKFVAQKRPSKFLGLLELLWPRESDSITSSAELRQSIKGLHAQKFCQHNAFSWVHLEETWLPNPQLQHQVQKYMTDSSIFPFLNIETTSNKELLLKWSFLTKDFAVGYDASVSALLEILSLIDYGIKEFTAIQLTKVLDLYIAIDAAAISSVNSHDDYQIIQEKFGEYCRIVIPRPNDSNEFDWVYPSECVWEGPSEMVTRYSLQSMYHEVATNEQLADLSRFFTRRLGISNATVQDTIEELIRLSEKNEPDFDRIKGVYTYLSQLDIQSSAGELRLTFEEKSLIFATKFGHGGWYKASDCLWSSTTDIRGKAVISEHYEGFEALFIDVLGIKTLTLQMVYDELRSGQHTSTNAARSLLWSFTSLLQTDSPPADAGPVLKANIFPIKYPGGETELRSADTEFSIPDREHLLVRFKDKIKLLDYNLEDLRFLEPFFSWANLDSRRLSKSVKQITSVSEGRTRAITTVHRDLKRKAHAILRVAKTFGSPRFQADGSDLYQLLRTVKVIETSGISTTWIVSQDGRSFEVSEPAGHEHLKEDASSLTIYVPMKRAAQSVCFSSTLPMKLVDWLMRDPKTQILEHGTFGEAVSALAAIVGIDILQNAVFEKVLDLHGIVTVDLANEDEFDADDEDIQSEIADNVDRRQISAPRPRNPVWFSNGLNTPETESSNEEEDDIESVSLVEVSARQSQLSRGHAGNSSLVSVETDTVPPPTYHSPNFVAHNAPVTSLENLQYRAILDNVVAAAGSTAFPSQGAFNLSALANALPNDNGSTDFDAFDGPGVVSRFRSSTQLERDKKIGAAGELCVFILLGCFLASWNPDNWKSTIRHYAKLHPEFSDLTSWIGRETADFVFDDTEGEMTNELIENGYLAATDWASARPKYFIEVKTTTGPCATPFYMSKNQYSLMRSKHDASNRSEVYMVLRVYWANSERIGMRVYVDPEQLRQDEQLVFVGETWSVVPGNGDEQKPRCQNCVARGVACEYGEWTFVSQGQPSARNGDPNNLLEASEDDGSESTVALAEESFSLVAEASSPIVTRGPPEPPRPDRSERLERPERLEHGLAHHGSPWTNASSSPRASRSTNESVASSKWNDRNFPQLVSSRKQAAMLRFRYQIIPWIDSSDCKSTFGPQFMRLAHEKKVIADAVLCCVDLLEKRVGTPRDADDGVPDYQQLLDRLLLEDTFTADVGRTFLSMLGVFDTPVSKWATLPSYYDEASLQCLSFQETAEPLKALLRLQLKIDLAACIVSNRPVSPTLPLPLQNPSTASVTSAVDAYDFCLCHLAQTLHLVHHELIPLLNGPPNAQPQALDFYTSKWAQWSNLWASCTAWIQDRPRGTAPVLESHDADVSSDAPFPADVYTSALALQANLAMHMSAIFLLAHKPRLVKLSRLAGGRLNSRSWHAQKVARMAVWNRFEEQWDPLAVAALLFVAREMTHSSQQQVLLSCFQRVGGMVQIPLEEDVAGLRTYWRLSTHGSPPDTSQTH